MADTKRRKRAKRKGRQRKSLNRSKRRVLKWNSRSRHGVFMRPAAKGRGNPIGTPKPPGPMHAAPAKAPVKADAPSPAKPDAMAAAKASVPAKAAQKTAPKTEEKTDGVKKATSQPSQIRPTGPVKNPEPPNRASGSQYKKAPPKSQGPQGKKGR
jgi:hypothetical protein